jgi:hypothetical protein
MNPAIAAWLFFRSLRWLLWLGFVACTTEFVLNRSAHLNQFGNLLHTTEAWMFGLPLGALFAGFLELMMRERTGLSRPGFGRNWVG